MRGQKYRWFFVYLRIGGQLLIKRAMKVPIKLTTVTSLPERMLGTKETKVCSKHLLINHVNLAGVFV